MKKILTERLGTRDGRIMIHFRSNPYLPYRSCSGPDPSDFIFVKPSESILTLSKTKRHKAEERISIYKDELLARVATTMHDS